MNTLLSSLKPEAIHEICLINNAATIGKITRIENITSVEIEKTIRLNTIVPLQCISEFIKTTQKWKCNKSIINISSGAAVKPYYGWAMYCASKAALDQSQDILSDVKNKKSVIQVDSGKEFYVLFEGE